MRNELIKSNIPKTAIYVSSRCWMHPDFACSHHYHDELEFITVYDNDFYIVVDEQVYTAAAGDVIFVNSGVPHRTFSTKSTRTGLVQFRESDFIDHDIVKAVKYSTKLNSLTECKVRIIKNEELFSSIDSIITEFCNRGAAYEIYVRSYVYKSLGCLYRMGVLLDGEQLYGTKEVQKILPAISYINKNYSENITLADMSEMLNFDASYFCRIFKIATGATFTEYLNFVRICHAEKLLSKTRDSILDISESVGFSSVSYFNRVFKKYRSCSPKSYRSAEYRNM